MMTDPVLPESGPAQQIRAEQAMFESPRPNEETIADILPTNSRERSAGDRPENWSFARLMVEVVDSERTIRNWPKTPLAQELSMTGPGVWAGYWGRRVGRVLKGVGEDVRESDHKVYTVGSFVTALGAQVADRLNLSLVLIPEVATNVLKDTQSAPLTGAAAAGTFVAWYLGVGGLLTEGIHQHPRALKAAEENFPSVVELFDDALPGVHPPEKAKSNEDPRLLHRLGKTVLNHVKNIPKSLTRRGRRGGTVVGMGTSAHVATASITGANRAETHALNVNAAIDGGLTLGAAVTVAAGIILEVGNHNPDLAQFAQDVVGSSAFWYSVAGGLVILEYRHNRKARKQLEQEQA